MCWNARMVKTTVFFIFDQLLACGTDTSWFYYSDFTYRCSSVRTTAVPSFYQSLTFEENIVAVITQDRVMDDNLKRQIKNQTLRTCRLFLLT